MGFLELFTGSNRGAPVTTDNPVPVNVVAGGITADTSALEAGIGTPDSTAAANPGVSANLIAAVKGMWTTLTAVLAALSSTSPATVVGLLAPVAVTPTVEATPDYSTGDVIGGVMTFSAILRADAATGYLTSLRITAKIINTVQIDAFVFSANPTGSTTTENGAFALADADRAKLKGVVQIKTEDWVGAGASASVGYKECRVPLTGVAADDIYIVMVARGTINLGSTSDLVVEATVDQN